MMTDAMEILRAIQAASLRTTRYANAQALAPNVWRILDRLVERGAIARITHGIYTAPPDGHDGRTWTPGLEAAGLAIATARHGDRNAILMGIGAARHWATIPRAIGDTVVAVPTAGHRPVTISSGTVHFIPRHLDRLDATLETTELGQALVTSPAQTLFDLLMRPDQGGLPRQAAEAADNLVPQIERTAFDAVIAAASRANTAVRQAARTIGVSR